MAIDADDPTRTLTLTRTLWGELRLNAVACEGSRLIRPKGMLWMGGAYFQTRAPGCAYNVFGSLAHRMMCGLSQKTENHAFMFQHIN